MHIHYESCLLDVLKPVSYTICHGGLYCGIRHTIWTQTDLLSKSKPIRIQYRVIQLSWISRKMLFEPIRHAVRHCCMYGDSRHTDGNENVLAYSICIWIQCRVIQLSWDRRNVYYMLEPNAWWMAVCHGSVYRNHKHTDSNENVLVYGILKWIQ